MELNNFLSMIANSLLIIALPFVIAAAIQHFRAMTAQLRAKMSEEQRQTVDKAVSVAVKAAEQLGGVGGLIGPEKKQQAIDIAQKFLNERGVKIDVGSLLNMIEAEVQTQFKQPKDLTDNAQARQALVDSAVQAAVVAAEQSGLQGLIQNLGPEKQAYALQLAGQTLAQYGVEVKDDLLKQLVDSHVMSMNAGAVMPAMPATPQLPVVQAPAAAAPPPIVPPVSGPGG